MGADREEGGERMKFVIMYLAGLISYSQLQLEVDVSELSEDVKNAIYARRRLKDVN